MNEFDPEDVELWLAPAPTFKKAVTVDLVDGTARSRVTGRDTFTSIESVTGTAVGDAIRGTEDAGCLYGYGGPDRIQGRGGDDIVYSGRGADRIDAGAGNDDVWLDTAAAHVRGGAGQDWTYWAGVSLVDLAQGVVRGPGARGSIGGVEDVSADFFKLSATIRRNAGPNVLSGHRVYGRGGDDSLWAITVADGGSGADACRAATEVRCESELPVE